jgi:hypothetical protein
LGRAVGESRYGEPLGIAASESATVLRMVTVSREHVKRAVTEQRAGEESRYRAPQWVRR